MSKYEVIVGNIGTVYDGDNSDEAVLHYHGYVRQSKSGMGRAGNETVVIMEDGEPMPEYDYDPIIGK